MDQFKGRIKHLQYGPRAKCLEAVQWNQLVLSSIKI